MGVSNEYQFQWEMSGIGVYEATKVKDKEMAREQVNGWWMKGKKNRKRETVALYWQHMGFHYSTK